MQFLHRFEKFRGHTSDDVCWEIVSLPLVGTRCPLTFVQYNPEPFNLPQRATRIMCFMSYGVVCTNHNVRVGELFWIPHAALPMISVYVEEFGTMSASISSNSLG